MRIWLALSLQFRATLASTIFSQLPGKKTMGLVTSKFNPASNNSNQCNSNIISMDGNSSWVGNKFSKTLTKLRMWWTCTTNILILLPLLINTMRSTLWLVSEVNKKKWSNSKRPTCRCNKCKWCSNSSNNSKCNSLTLVASHLNSSTARCSRCSSSSRCSNSSKCSSSNSKDSECIRNSNSNNSNSHNGKHSSNLALLVLELKRKPMQEALEISARFSPRLKTTIKQRPDNTTMDWSILAQDNKKKCLLEEDSHRRLLTPPHSRT